MQISVNVLILTYIVRVILSAATKISRPEVPRLPDFSGRNSRSCPGGGTTSSSACTWKWRIPNLPSCATVSETPRPPNTWGSTEAGGKKTAALANPDCSCNICCLSSNSRSSSCSSTSCRFRGRLSSAEGS